MLDFFRKMWFHSRARRPIVRDVEPEKMSLQPVYVRDLFGGKVTIVALGASRNWNYAGDTPEEIEANNPGITSALAELIETYKIEKALVPKPAFNAEVATEADLPIELLPKFFRGAKADGVLLMKKKHAYLLASADCLTVVLYDRRTDAVEVLHCGTNAIVDRARLDIGVHQKRANESVIGAGIQRLDDLVRAKLAESGEENDMLVADHSGIEAYLAVGIRPGEDFEHPTVDHAYAEKNGHLIDWLSAYEVQTDAPWIDVPYKGRCRRPHYAPLVVHKTKGQIDLFSLVRRQLGELNVSSISEDEFDTATSKDAAGEFRFHSNRRNNKLRNVIAVIRN